MDQQELIGNANLYHLILSSMKDAQMLIALDGSGKKTHVLNMIREKLPDDTFQRFKPFIEHSIDFIIRIARNRDLLKELINSDKKCLPSMLCFRG